jgi:hypothetical protein
MNHFRSECGATSKEDRYFGPEQLKNRSIAGTLLMSERFSRPRSGSGGSAGNAESAAASDANARADEICSMFSPGSGGISVHSNARFQRDVCVLPGTEVRLRVFEELKFDKKFC